MEVLGYIFAIVIGFVLGFLGGGGSVLSVPVFVYLFGMDAMTATSLSLFVVGVTSTVGSVKFLRQGLVDFKTALMFGGPSVLGILFSRRLVLPHLPEYIINRWGITLTKEMFILVLFAVLMLISAVKMIGKDQRPRVSKWDRPNYTILASQGILVGILTGLIGAGGGFLIVPALVMLLGVGMKNAVATSLFIIAINSLIGFGSSLDKVTVDWFFLLSFSALSVVGILLGVGLSKKVEGRKLKPVFGWFILILGVWIIFSELFLRHVR
ncbi:sulfite exporter TauE/SafE family protein [Bergeyella sp. RCAD1439]|uniref:sulfite exporter TauE/SafE family protein n=1 Tax=Bergeyella anatis TaxID=3113737 RepID=UPI002E196DAF|nr:sulfite exporter TauE/SafE family protein [Bergeyella sp. RCAD1439]